LLCHNICWLIQSAYELEVEAKFWQGDPKGVLEVDSQSGDNHKEAWAWF